MPLDSLPFSNRRLRSRIIISYIADYVILIACIVGFYILDSIEPYHQHFSLRNISLQYPYAVHERVPIKVALCISCLAPAIIIVIYTLFIDGLFSHHKPRDPVSGKKKVTGPYRFKDRLWELNCGILGLLLSQGLAFVITQVLKNACGKPRPDLIDRCQPRPGSEDLMPYGLSNSSICTGDEKIIKDGFRSWPSGHSSSSFAGLLYLSLWLCGKLHVMDNRGEVWKTILVMIPILGATLIAVSRIMDARHHPFDVITGSMLGIICACVSYRQYFPSITEAWKKGRAYPIRTWASEPRIPVGAYDDSTVALANPEEERFEPTRVPTRVPSTGSAQDNPSYHFQSNNPFARTQYNRSNLDDNGAWSSSSEDVADSYEMHHSYTRTPNLGAMNSQVRGYDVDTAYPSQPQGASATNIHNGALHTPSDVMMDQADRDRSVTRQV
ncbi:hypothetical protein MAP00_008877 [Monascus purpureus]|nr:hypothetical protein MAP00_008877 [Monascus purpureus]